MNARTVLLGVGTFVGGVAALAVGAVALTTRRLSETVGQGVAASNGEDADEDRADNGPTPRPQPAPTVEEGHAASDLAPGQDLGPDHRAPEAFRPDMDAPMTAAEREALRPAAGPSPSLVSDEGSGVQGAGGDLR